jgi:hypothetical protein
MNFKISFFWLSIIVLTTLSSCRNNFEWININPEKIQLARKPQPVLEKKIKKISIKIDLKEKDSVKYYNEPTGFFTDEDKRQNLVNAPLLIQNTSTLYIPKKSVKSRYKRNSVAKQSEIKTISPVLKKSEKKTDIPKIEEPSSKDKLNGSIILPAKPNVKNSNSTKANLKSNPETANQMRSKAFDDIKKQNPEIESKQAEKIKRGEYLMYGGLILTVFGVIMGFVFGKTAYIISIVGVVFAAIGAVMKFYIG